MDAPEDRSKALNEHMSSGFAPRADIVAACRHVRFVPQAAVSDRSKSRAYSITSSARARSVGGTISPSTFAAHTWSALAPEGRPAFSPLRMRST